MVAKYLHIGGIHTDDGPNNHALAFIAHEARAGETRIAKRLRPDSGFVDS